MAKKAANTATAQTLLEKPSPAKSSPAKPSSGKTSRAKTGKNLVIVESPAKAKTINKYLGDDYIVMASMGHIRDLPSSGMGVDLETFEPAYVVIEERGKGKLVTELRKLAAAAPLVYLA